MTEIEAAWLAGLYEGEGCLSKDNRNYLWRLQIAMSDLDVIEKVAKLFETTVYTHKDKRKASYKTMYRVIVYNQDKIRELCERMLPYLGERRKSKIKECFEVLSNSKYGKCRKGLHDIKETRTSSGNTTRCHLCKMEYQKQYRIKRRG